MNTVEKVFYAIAKDNLHTRREISEKLGFSFVTASKSVDILISAGLITSIGKSDSYAGRRSDFLDVSPSTKVLLINLCETNLSYSYSSLCNADEYVRSLLYIDSLDFADNLLMLINDIKKHIMGTPMKIAIAVPGEMDNGRIYNTYVNDYSGFNIAEMLSNNSLPADIIVSASEAVESSCLFAENDVFISVSKSTWGTFGRKKIEHWGNLKIDNHNLLTFDEALRCSDDENKIVNYSLRLINILENVLSPERILFSCDRLSNLKISEMIACSPKLKHVDSNTIIFDGLMKLAVTEIFKGI